MNNMIKRQLFRIKVQKMCKSVNSNHKNALRLAFKYWASQNMLRKTKLFMDYINKLFLFQIRIGFDEICFNWRKARHNQQINGLMALMNANENFEMNRKKQVMKHLISEFSPDANPWFKKVIDIWTYRMKPNYQISFWTLRYAKPKFATNLSAEQAVHVKKMESILRVMVNRMMFRAFMNLDKYAADIAEKKRKEAWEAKIASRRKK